MVTPYACGEAGGTIACPRLVASRVAAAVQDDFSALRLENPSVESPGEPLNLDDIRNALKSLMWRNVGVRRDAEGLAEAEENINHWCGYVLARQFADPGGWELQNMLCAGRLMIQAALRREETRGCHFRGDFPRRDDQHWNCHTLFRRDPSGRDLVASSSPVEG